MANPLPNAPYFQGVVGGEPFNLTTSTTVKSSESHLVGIWCSTAGTLGVYNGTSTAGTPIAKEFAVAAGFWYPMPFHCTNGLFVNISGGTPNVTVSFF